MNEATPFTELLKFPANYRIPAHWHPATERITVLSGKFYMGMGEVLDTAKGIAIPTGGFAVMQPRRLTSPTRPTKRSSCSCTALALGASHTSTQPKTREISSCRLSQHCGGRARPWPCACQPVVTNHLIWRIS